MSDPNPVGLTFISNTYTNSLDTFWIIINPGILLSPFDFVNVQNVSKITTIGIVKEIKRINLTDEVLSNTPNLSTLYKLRSDQPGHISGVTIARVDVISNFMSEGDDNEGYARRLDVKLARKKIHSPIINMPLEEGKVVHFASSQEIRIALGMPEMERPIPAGLITMTNNTKIPIDLDVTYIFGPDTTHVNATGISGNMKTSYLLFLLQVIHQKLLDEGISIIIFNTKEKDLLYIDKPRIEDFTNDDQSIFETMNVEFSPFKNVSYYLPRGRDGRPNSAGIPEGKNVKTYSYELSDVYDRLDMLFSSESMVDQHHNLSAILNYIYESWPYLDRPAATTINATTTNTTTTTNESNPKMNWNELVNFVNYPEEIISHKSTLLKFQGMLQRFYKPGTIFVDKKITSTYLGKEIRNMKSNQVVVIDIAMLPTLEEQAFVVGDTLKTINEMYSMEIGGNGVDTSSNASSDNKKNQSEKRNESKNSLETEGSNSKKPKYVVILLDEINRFLPYRDLSGSSFIGHGSNRTSVGAELFKTLLTGRSRHCILFSAQQFKSQIDPGINENTGMHIVAKLGNSELSTRPYNMIDDITKSVVSKLHKGEFILVHSAFRHPIKITIPRSAFKKL